MLYNTLILPHLWYGVCLWAGNNNTAYKLQKRALRMTARCAPIEHTEPIFKVLNLLKLQDIYNLGLLVFYYKLVNEELPEYFKAFDPRNNNTCAQLVLRRNRILLPRVKLEATKKCTKYQMAKLLLELPDVFLNLAQTETLSLFKKMTKAFFLNKYSMDCNIANCYTCRTRRNNLNVAHV